MGDTAHARFSIVEHLDELRRRIMLSLAACIACSVVVYRYIPFFLPAFIKPVNRLVFVSPAEAFNVYMTLALCGGVMLAAPYIFYQAWRFAGCALTPSEQRYIVLFGSISLMLFILGCCVGYFGVLPLGIVFLLSFGSDILVPMISAGKYTQFVCTITLVFGCAFQLPIVMFFAARVGLCSTGMLMRRWREAILGIIIIAGIVTPPDIISQLLLAGPLIGLYFLSVAGCRFAKSPQKHGQMYTNE